MEVHSGAAGFTIKIENIEEFYQRVDKYIGENFPKELFIKTIKIENILAPYKVNYEFLRELEILEPYGAKITLQFLLLKIVNMKI